MFKQNNEYRIGLIILVSCAVLLTTIGFFITYFTGIFVAITGSCTLAVYIVIEHYRYRKLKKLSWDLDMLLTNGTILSIQDYAEGELSVLANQIEKITLLLVESASAVTSEKQHLADSLADISHQLRTPLTTMNLTITMLQDPVLPHGKRMELMREMRSLLHRTEWLVETLLKLSKLDAGTVKLKRDPIQVRQLIHHAAEPLIIPMELRKQTLHIYGADASFIGDPVWSEEALSNILKNCMEHAPECGAITVSVEESPLFTKIEIADNGPGFDPKDIPHLFERYYKGRNASENSYGIGLALARTIIHAQNGTIKATNTTDGAKFVIKFYKQVI